MGHSSTQQFNRGPRTHGVMRGTHMFRKQWTEWVSAEVALGEHAVTVLVTNMCKCPSNSSSAPSATSPALLTSSTSSRRKHCSSPAGSPLDKASHDRSNTSRYDDGDTATTSSSPSSALTQCPSGSAPATATAVLLLSLHSEGWHGACS